MSKRFFYADPLAAAWMAKHHGVLLNFNDFDGISYIKCSDVPLTGNYADIDGRVARFRVHPDCLHLLQPQVGDVLYTKAGGGVSLEEIVSEERQSQAHYIIARGGRIIQRNGKVFHWPECEAA